MWYYLGVIIVKILNHIQETYSGCNKYMFWLDFLNSCPFSIIFPAYKRKEKLDDVHYFDYTTLSYFGLTHTQHGIL